MYCNYCGKYNSEDSVFCQYCGTQLTKVSFKDELYEELIAYFESEQSKLYCANFSFSASTNLIVLKPGNSFNLTVRSTGNNGITCDEDVKDIVSYCWSKWNGNTVDLIVTGIKQGTTLMKFTKDGDSRVFYVLIIVLAGEAIKSENSFNRAVNAQEQEDSYSVHKNFQLKGKICPNCGEINDSHKQFCAYCGVYIP